VGHQGQPGSPLMLAVRRGLIINTVAWDRGLYLGNLFDVAKAHRPLEWQGASPYGVVLSLSLPAL
jgi:hypothetical protein